MKITVDAYWDDEAKVWVASSREQIGLVTSAPTLEALERRIALVLPDLMEGDHKGPFEVELITRRTHLIAAE
jgi:hypothetical protein